MVGWDADSDSRVALFRWEFRAASQPRWFDRLVSELVGRCFPYLYFGIKITSRVCESPKIRMERKCARMSRFSHFQSCVLCYSSKMEEHGVLELFLFHNMDILDIATRGPRRIAPAVLAAKLPKI